MTPGPKRAPIWRTVMQLEWRILKRDRAALVILALFCAFLIASAVAGGRHAGTLAVGLERTGAEEDARFAELKAQLDSLSNADTPPNADTPLTAKDPRDPAWMGQEGAARLAILPPSPLAAIAVGQRDLHAQAVRVTSGVHLTEERETETPMSGPTRLMTGAFDPTFLFVVLFPLVIIALSYELLSGERERGTLAMLLSQPVTQQALVFGKAGARVVALCAVTLFFAFVGLLVGGANFSAPGAGLHITLYALILVAWALFWFAAAIAVNAWGTTSARNALLLVGMWLILVVVVPGLLRVVVDTVYPPPSRIELLHEAREAAQEAEKELDGLTGTHGTTPKADDYAKRVATVQDELARRSAPVLTELRDQLRKRQAVSSALRFASPAVVVQLALEDVAGAGAARHQRFEDQVDAFHIVFRSYFTDRVQEGARFSSGDLAEVPTLAFQEESAAALLWRVLAGVFALLLAGAALLAIAWPGLKRIGRLAR